MADKTGFSKLFDLPAQAKLLQNGTDMPETPDEDAVIGPDMGGEYRAYAAYRGRNMPALILYFNAAERLAHSMKKQQTQYHNLESDDKDSGFADDGQSFSLVFVTSATRMRLTVGGRNIEKLYDLAVLHKLAWIRSIDAKDDRKEILPDDAQVVTGITLEAIEEE